MKISDVVEKLKDKPLETIVEIEGRWFMKGKPDPKHPNREYYTSNISREDLLDLYKEIQENENPN